MSALVGTAAAAVVQTLADGSLADEDGLPIVFGHRKLLERRLLESYGKRHALQISLGVVLSFMAVKVGQILPLSHSAKVLLR